MNGMISLICPGCGGALKAAPEQVTLTCAYCGSEHQVRHEGNDYKLESFASCPMCKRNDQAQKFSAMIRGNPNLTIRPEFTERLEGMYYCRRDDIVYVPGEHTSTPLNDMIIAAPLPVAKPPSGLFNVFLTQTGPKKINVIVAIRALTGADLAEAKQIAETPGTAVLKAVSRQRAEQARDELVKAGALVEILPE